MEVKIPRMHSDTAAAILRDLGSRLSDGDTVVEQGVWLGASMQEVIHGAAGKSITTIGYDRFSASSSEVEKAGNQGVKLTSGQDTLPIVQKNLPSTKLFKIKDIKDSTYQGGPIALYIDDANKQEDRFLIAMHKFTPWFIPGKTVLALMDYWYFKSFPEDSPKRKPMEVQHRYMKDKLSVFRPLTSAYPAASLQTFLYLGLPKENSPRKSG
jgi:hypothetical protein